MFNDVFPLVLDSSRCLPIELFGDRVRKSARCDESDLRAGRTELYASRLMQGLDIWTGKPLPDACVEATRIQAEQGRPKRGKTIAQVAFGPMCVMATRKTGGTWHE